MGIVEYVPLNDLKKLSMASPIFDEVINGLGIKVVSHEDSGRLIVHDLRINRPATDRMFMPNYGVCNYTRKQFKVVGRMVIRFHSGLLIVLDTRQRNAECDYYSGFCPALLMEDHVKIVPITYKTVDNADQQLSCIWGRMIDRKNKRAIINNNGFHIIEYKNGPDESIKSDTTIIRGMRFVPRYIDIVNKVGIKFSDNNDNVYYDHFEIIYADGQWIK